MHPLVMALRWLPNYMEKLNMQFIQNELVSFADSLPGVTSVGLVRVDGLMVDFYRKSGNLDEDRMAAMSAAMLSLGERIAGDLGGGRLRSTIITGDEARIFEVLVGNEHVLIAVIQNVQSYDEILIQMAASAQQLSD